MLLCPQETRVLPHILQAAFLVPRPDSLRILRAISKSSVQYMGLNEKSGWHPLGHFWKNQRISEMCFSASTRTDDQNFFILGQVVVLTK